MLLQEALCEAEAELETDGDGEVEGEVETEAEYPAVIVEPVPSAGRLEQCFAAQVLVYDDQTYLMQGVAQEQEVETEMVESGKGFSSRFPYPRAMLDMLQKCKSESHLLIQIACTVFNGSSCFRYNSTGNILIRIDQSS